VSADRQCDQEKQDGQRVPKREGHVYGRWKSGIGRCESSVRRLWPADALGLVSSV
jgi:hypothetical protein